MGLFDRFRRREAPRRVEPYAPRRLAAPRRRGYDAGQDSRLLYSWITGQASADRDVRQALKRLRARSRDLADNNDYARRFLQVLENNVVGPDGVRLQARAKRPDGRLDEPDNALIEDRFKQWAKRGVCTVDGRHSLNSAARLVLRSCARDGEVLVRLVRGRPAGNRHGIALQIIESDQLDFDYWATARNGNEIRMGVEIDRFSRPVAYYLLPYHPGDDVMRRGATERERVPAEDVVHVYRPDRSSQTRGVPWIASAIMRLKMLGGYEEAELVAARTASAKMGFFVSPDGEAGPQEDVTKDGDHITDAQPGSFERLAAGEDFKPFDPQHPTTAFDGFVKALLRGTSAGLGVSYHALSNDLSEANYSSLRQGALEDRDAWRTLQSWLIECFYEPVYAAWLEMAIVSGALPLPFSRLDKFRSVEWQPRGWQWVDPLKEVNAHKIAVEQGFKSRRQIVAETGKDFEAVVQEIAADNDLAAKNGVTFGESTALANEGESNADPQGDQD